LTLALVNQTASADRLAAVNRIRDNREAAQPAVDALVLTLKSDPNVNVRLAAVDALSGFLDQRYVRDEMNNALVSQTSPMVQVSIIEALSGAEDEQLLRTLQSIAQDEHADPLVREHARMRIEKRL
jgi:HEAT repeat protein